MAPLRIVFFGTGHLACESLSALSASPDTETVSVITQPDRPQGRHLQPQPSPVGLLAATLNLPLLQPVKARSPEFVAELARLKPELIVVAAYGQILPRSILDLPRQGCLNVHASLLPRYRGAAPIQWAILDDQPETGVTIMKMDEGLDTGDILSQETTAIAADDDGRSLHDRLAQMGARLLLKTIPEYISGSIAPRKQPAAGASYARKITKEDGRLDWTQPARALWNRVRALVPWPGAFTTLDSGSKPVLLKIWQTAVAENVTGSPGQVIEAHRDSLVFATGDTALRILSLQKEGGKRLTAAQFLAGHGLKAGDVLGKKPS